MDEGFNPLWSIEDIRFLAEDWAATKPVWDALQKFITWLDKSPSKRLPQLAALLTGDERMRLKFSAPQQTKTLAEIFISEV